jgi:hypothetical protein
MPTIFDLREWSIIMFCNWPIVIVWGREQQYPPRLQAMGHVRDQLFIIEDVLNIFAAHDDVEHLPEVQKLI